MIMKKMIMILTTQEKMTVKEKKQLTERMI